MSLIETINFRKAELAEVMSQLNIATDRKKELENEIADLEYRLESEKINIPIRR